MIFKNFEIRQIKVALQFVWEQQTRCACSYDYHSECSLGLINWIFAWAAKGSSLLSLVGGMSMLNGTSVYEGLFQAVILY